VQRRGSTAYVPNGCGHSVRYVRPLGSLCLMTLDDCTLREVADELGVTRFAGVPTFLNCLENCALSLKPQASATLSIESSSRRKAAQANSMRLCRTYREGGRPVASLNTRVK